MKKFSKIFLALAAVVGLWSCSSDENSDFKEKGGNFYARLTLALPQSRSNTTPPDDHNSNSSDGYEVGNSKENEVHTILVVLANEDNSSVITSSLVDAYEGEQGTYKRPSYNVRFQNGDIYQQAGNKVNVFAFCNPSADLVETVNGENAVLADLIGDINENIWADNNFLMSNAHLAPITLPAGAEMLKHDSPANPCDLGTVYVERAAVRFDFKQKAAAEDGSLAANQYAIMDPGTTTQLGTVTLTGMALFNVAKEFYYLPRVSADGTGTAATLCGVETPANYVVSPNWVEKKKDPLIPSWVKGAYLYNMLGDKETPNTYFTPKSLVFDPIGTNLGEDKDPTDENGGAWGPNDKGIPGYMIWKYCTENTIPSPVSTQRHSITTGVCFKGNISATGALAGKLDGTNVIFALNGKLIGTWADVKAIVAAQPTSEIALACQLTLEANNITTDLANVAVTDIKKTQKGGLAIYRPEGGTYPCYYYYYNRHNDNGEPVNMGPMEFAVVRNNIYKLSVNSLFEFGHPGDPGDDPDPENPEDPDESPKIYFSVKVYVLNWVVRINTIDL